MPILITGMGAWTPAGSSVGEQWANVLAGRSPAHSILLEGFRGGISVPVCEAPTPAHLPNELRHMKRTDRSVLLAIPAAMEAWQSAQMPERQIAGDRVAVIVGSSRGTTHANAEAAMNFQQGRAYPSHAAHANPASISGTISSIIGATGPCFVVSAACASSAVAMATAAQLLLHGVVDVALVGGAEAPLHPSTLAVLQASGILASHADPSQACRPFDAHRNGTVMGEGAAFVVMESSARKDRPRPLARLAGWGITSEPGERVGIRPGGQGLADAMRQALMVSALQSGDIGYVNAHGTGTMMNDHEESMAIRNVFQDQRPLTSSTKPVTGHCMGAAAAIEAILAIQAMNAAIAPPTANCDHPDPSCGLNLVQSDSVPFKTKAVMSNSSGFWGNHASLVFEGVD